MIQEKWRQEQCGQLRFSPHCLFLGLACERAQHSESTKPTSGGMIHYHLIVQYCVVAYWQKKKNAICLIVKL